MIGLTHTASGAHSVGLGVPALAVVDSRNVIHQAEDVLGYRCKPTVAGVIDALSLYGYDVLEVHVGLALAREVDREALSRSHAENLAYLRTVEAHPRGRCSKASCTAGRTAGSRRRWSTWPARLRSRGTRR